jgi:hypothetical protein
MNEVGITRVDRYNLLVDGVRVAADEDLERRIRQMTPAQLANFVTIFGGARATGDEG